MVHLYKKSKGEKIMSCNDIKKNNIFKCKKCGMEIQVIKECEKREKTCSCNENSVHFMCCNEKLSKK